MTCATPSPRFNVEKYVEFVCRWSIFFEAHRRPNLTFLVISENTCLLSNQTNTNIDSGEGVEKYAILRLGNEFCPDHCVLVMINHKSVPHIYGTPLVGRFKPQENRERLQLKSGELGEAATRRITGSSFLHWILHWIIGKRKYSVQYHKLFSIKAIS